jgi:hypothetical protein
MVIAISVLIALLAVGVVIYPFVKARFRPSDSRNVLSRNNETGAGADDYESREVIYEDIRTLQLDHDLGIIEEAEYRERMRAYRLQAASTLRDRERLEMEIDRQLEEEVLAARSALQEKGPSDDMADRDISDRKEGDSKGEGRPS